MPPVVGAFVGLLLAVGTVDGVETASFHDHRYAGIVTFCWSLLIPEKDRYAG